MTTKKTGRPTRYDDGRTRQMVTLSLFPHEVEAMKAATEKYNISQSDMLRFIVANPWLLNLRDKPEQLALFRTLAVGG